MRQASQASKEQLMAGLRLLTERVAQQDREMAALRNALPAQQQQQLQQMQLQHQQQLQQMQRDQAPGGFGQALLEGAAFGAGFAAGEVVVDATIDALFGGDDEEDDDDDEE
jgi:hypothetical protein